ncbi:hypothetical protein IQ249_21645 [Lusitaniella coriacea LEGE 07157]|uniref:DEP domain-containing protein n=1 Tax=Lusitaniella coriacea LEGE 07157 TaxID=945747 RepID=A0A8J7IX49_9CYAN|nr:DEP domain-containing protein [Lusitaniella coriacea]MBE9118498.1 hypothetical protein [Lusitaniella coriacea LEGE 07157]
MLLLNHKQVRYHLLIRPTGVEIEIVPGVIYQNKQFVRGKSYPKEQRQIAIKQSRQFFEEQEEQRLCLLIESPRSLTLWHEDPQAKLANSETLDANVVENLSLKQVVRYMRGKDGLDIQERRYHLTAYPKCFVGGDAVKWMVKRLKLSPTEAIHLGQRLIEEKWIHHVADKHSFKDEALFYRFYLDE